MLLGEHYISEFTVILGNRNLRIVIRHSSRGETLTMRKFPFPRIHGLDHD